MDAGKEVFLVGFVQGNQEVPLRVRNHFEAVEEAFGGLHGRLQWYSLLSYGTTPNKEQQQRLAAVVGQRNLLDSENTRCEYGSPEKRYHKLMKLILSFSSGALSISERPLNDTFASVCLLIAVFLEKEERSCLLLTVLALQYKTNYHGKEIEKGPIAGGQQKASRGRQIQSQEPLQIDGIGGVEGSTYHEQHHYQQQTASKKYCRGQQQGEQIMLRSLEK